MLFFILEIIYPRIPGALPPQDFLLSAAPENILSLYMKYLANLSIWAAGILALIMLVYGGILYLFSTGKPGAMVTARNQIISAFFGLLLVLSSFLILKTINPEFVILKLPSLQAPQISLPPEIKPPEITAIQTSIDAEMPFSRIIEKLFETYISEYPQPKDSIEPRMLRIKNISRAVIGEDKDKGLADKLKEQSEKLKNYSGDCQCSQTRPCCEISDPGPGCKDNACHSKLGTTSDPCKKVRADIQEAEEENLKTIYKGIEIVQFDEEGQKEKITTSLVKEQTKTEEEIRFLKEWLDRLKRAEKFILECPKRSLNSLAQFYSKKDYFDSQKWITRETKFWGDVSIRYYTGKNTQNQYGSWYSVPSKEIGTDFATFYCSISGTMEQVPSYSTLTQSQQQASQLSEEEVEEVLSEEMACSKEAPVGEIIDRTKRVTQLLIDKMEVLLGKEKELIDAVDKLQALVSQCSSQRCYSYCHKMFGGACIKRAQNAPQYLEGPCPKTKIDDQLKKVQRIWQEIKDIIEGKKMSGQETPKEKVEKMGIIPLIDEIIPEILNDLEEKVRQPMHECSSKNWAEQTKSLFNCIQAKGAIKPGGKVIFDCCRIESLDNQGNLIQTVYGDCFEECYLEKGIEKHRECVQTCLDKKAQVLDDQELSRCTHELNFYCCP